MGIYGQDWASYQSDAPDTSGLAFFFTKITQGMGYENPRWKAQYAHGKGAGLVPGKYHYPDMNNSPSAEGDYFLARASIQTGDMVALDWEGYDKANQGVPKATQAAYKDAWLKYVKAKLPRNPVGMYCNTDYWRNVDHTGFYGDFLWIATAGAAAGQPGIQAPWLFHQYSTAGGIDHDYCHLASKADLQSWVKSFQTPVKPPAPAPALVEDDVYAYLPPIPANQDVDIPVDPSGTTAHPQGGARNATLWLSFAPQGANATVTYAEHTAKGWGKPQTWTLTLAGERASHMLPTDGSVDKVRIHSTAPLIGYLIGRQVA